MVWGLKGGDRHVHMWLAAPPWCWRGIVARARSTPPLPPPPLSVTHNVICHTLSLPDIVTRTIENKQDAVDYLTWTLFYRCVRELSCCC
jgi:hypothetical protein